MNYIKPIIAGITGFLIGAAFVWNLIGHTCSDGQSQWFATSLWGKFTCMPIRNMK